LTGAIELRWHILRNDGSQQCLRTGRKRRGLLCAAFAVAPLTWRSRLLGLLAGIAVVFAINQARILLLFYAYRADHTLFDPLHALVTPIAVVLLVAAYFYAWLFLTQRHVQST